MGTQNGQSSAGNNRARLFNKLLADYFRTGEWSAQVFDINFPRDAFNSYLVRQTQLRGKTRVEESTIPPEDFLP